MINNRALYRFQHLRFINGFVCPSRVCQSEPKWCGDAQVERAQEFDFVIDVPTWDFYANVRCSASHTLDSKFPLHPLPRQTTQLHHAPHLAHQHIARSWSAPPPLLANQFLCPRFHLVPHCIKLSPHYGVKRFEVSAFDSEVIEVELW